MEQSSDKQHRITTVVIISIILLIILAASILGYRILNPKKQPQKTSDAPVLIVATQPKAAIWKLPFTTFGTIDSKNSVDVSAEANGRITKIVPQQPGVVHKGDLLFQVFNQTQKGGLEAQKSQLAYAKRNLTRQHRLLKVGAISKNEYDIALQNYKTTLGNVKSASGSLSLTSIYAPITGSIGIVAPSVGDYVKEGSRLATINPLNNMYIRFTLPAFLEHTLHLGDKIQFTNPALSKPAQAKIYEIDNKVDIDTRQIMVKAYFNNTTPNLLPGDYVTLIVQVGKARSILIIPDTAVKYSLMGTAVYKIVNHKAVEVPVKIVQRRNKVVGITSKSLSASDSIIADGITKVMDGTTVRADGNYESH